LTPLPSTAAAPPTRRALPCASCYSRSHTIEVLHLRDDATEVTPLLPS
jgi:hypothetical protein